MILPLANAGDAWDEVTQGVSAGPVLIFVASPDPDALAAARTLTALLRADLVRYELHPVTGYAHLRTTFRALVEGEAGVVPRAVLCINCGAGVDLGAVLGINTSENEPARDQDPKDKSLDGDETEGGDEEDSKDGDGELKVFVLDSHRPYHLRNVSSTKVWVFDDSPVEFDTAELPLDIGWEDEWGNVSDVESLPDESSSGESDDEGSLDGSGSDRAESDGDDSAGDEDDEEDDVRFDANADVDGEAAKSRQRKRRRKQRTRRRMRRRTVNEDERKERQLLRDYYAASPTGMSSACLAHNLAAVLRRAGLESLWAAIAGVTYQYLSGSVEADFYQEAVEYCRKQIADLSPRDLRGQGAAGHGRGEDGPVQNSGYGVGGGRGRGGESSVGLVLPSTEYRLDLVRHWTLYDCLRFSSYTTTRLAAWRKTGIRRIEELLATLGIPLKESRQQWCYMGTACKAALDDKLYRAVRRFDLGKDIQYDSFVRVLPGHRGKISAADVVFGLQATLELDCEDPKRCFFRAFDALSGSGLETAMSLAVGAQRLVAEIGGELIERRRFISSGPFRYTLLRDVASPELFAHPLILHRLGLFLHDAMIRQGARNKPFVVMAPNRQKGIWHVVAVTSAGARNDFGAQFRRAARKNGSTVWFDGFSAPSCQVQDGQETDFVRYLHDILL